MPCFFQGYFSVSGEVHGPVYVLFLFIASEGFLCDILCFVKTCSQSWFLLLWPCDFPRLVYCVAQVAWFILVCPRIYLHFACIWANFHRYPCFSAYLCEFPQISSHFCRYLRYWLIATSNWIFLNINANVFFNCFKEAKCSIL